MYLKAHNYWYC